jgi:hypothetical protein
MGWAGDVLAVQIDRAVVGGDQAGDHVEAGGLAGAVGAQQARDLAALQAQGDALDDRAVAERLADGVDEQAYGLAAGFLSLSEG